MTSNEELAAMGDGAIAGVFTGVLILIGLTVSGPVGTWFLAAGAGFATGSLLMVVIVRCFR